MAAESNASGLQHDAVGAQRAGDILQALAIPRESEGKHVRGNARGYQRLGGSARPERDDVRARILRLFEEDRLALARAAAEPMVKDVDVDATRLVDDKPDDELDRHRTIIIAASASPPPGEPRRGAYREGSRGLVNDPMFIMAPDLTDEETAALIRLLRDTIDNDRYPLSSRVQTLRGILAKFRPEPPRRPLPPPPKVYAPPRASAASRRGNRR